MKNKAQTKQSGSIFSEGKAESDDENYKELGDSAQMDDGDNNQNNTIMQQINNFSLTPLNDQMAEATIEDHKYLLELVENRCAIAYFAVANRNQSLFRALQKYYNTLMMNNDDDEFIDN